MFLRRRRTFVVNIARDGNWCDWAEGADHDATVEFGKSNCPVIQWSIQKDEASPDPDMDMKQTVTDQQRQIVDRARKVLTGGSLGNIYDEVVLVEGHGGRVRDAAGREYVDYLLGSGPMLVGHAHPKVTEAVCRQLEMGTTFFATNEQAIALAERIVDACPCAEKVRFVASGSEATLYAMRAVRSYRRREAIMKFEGGYHGMNDYSLMSQAPNDPPDFPKATPDSAGIPSIVADQVLIAPFNDIQMTTDLIRQHHDRLAGVIVEPIQRLIPPREGFLAALRQVTSEHEVPLIFDEIVTGFRFAYGGAQEYYGVVPDVCVLSKAMTAGFAIAAIAGREDIMAGFDPATKKEGRFMPMVTTFGGNPLAAAASLAALEVLKELGTYERLFDTGRQLMRALERLFKNASIPAQVVGEPPMFDVFFTETPIIDYRSTLSSDTAKLRRFRQLLLERGVFRGDSKMYISIAHTQADIDQTINAFEEAIDQLGREQ